ESRDPAFRRVNHELRTHGCADRLVSEAHAPGNDAQKARLHPSGVLIDERGERIVSPGILKENAVVVGSEAGVARLLSEMEDLASQTHRQRSSCVSARTGHVASAQQERGTVRATLCALTQLRQMR